MGAFKFIWQRKYDFFNTELCSYIKIKYDIGSYFVKKKNRKGDSH